VLHYACGHGGIRSTQTRIGLVRWLERALQVRVLLTVPWGLVIPLGPVTSGAM
jgi:hypothetical protein